MRPLFIIAILYSFIGLSQSDNTQERGNTKALTNDWMTIQKDTSITGTLLKLCNSIGKKSDVNRLANIDIILLSNSDTIYLAVPQTYKGIPFKIGSKNIYEVEPWRNNYLINSHCRLNKQIPLVTIKK